MVRVYVGLSGGVDSAVSAALLSRDGHDVVGCFIRITRPEFIECTWREDRLDAMRVAAHLRIPFREVDLSDAYSRLVISDMIETYERGETPNPDILCNSRIKFDAFLSWALDEGADMIATGHYARVSHDPVGLYCGIDEEKDQSYFLSRVSPEALSRVLTPVGGMTKRDVRALAQECELPVATKRDSQGLCFVGDVTLPEFLSRFISPREGEALNQQGGVIGTHAGACLYTIGQRHGFRVDDARPHYVTRIDTHSNTITVSPDPADATSTRVRLHSLNWLSTPKTEYAYAAAPRYRSRVPAVVESIGAETIVRFPEPTIAAPGQTCVIYDGDQVVGAGVIAVHST